MNPLFASHIIADFLLQPKWLASWKEKHFSGVLLHALIHALVMSVLLLPNQPRIFVMIFFIAAFHAVIDQLKISYQKKQTSFAPAFFLDQIAHFAIIIAAIFLFGATPMPFWRGEAGVGVLSLLFFFSFVIGFWHLAHLEKLSLQNLRQKTLMFILLVVVFAMFFMPAKLFAASACSLF